jgi:hypothetical protein
MAKIIGTDGNGSYWSGPIQSDDGLIFPTASTTPTNSAAFKLYMNSSNDLFWWDGTIAKQLNWGVQNVVLTGNDQTITATAKVVFVDAGGGSRTGIIVADGVQDGQQIKIVNIADAAETITFAASGTSNVAPGASLVIGQNEGVELVWNTATSLWYPLITVFS